MKRAVLAFSNQTYENRQLILVCESSAEHNRKIAELVAHVDNVKHVPVIQDGDAPAHSMGWIRNATLDNADGDFIIQWDDDDIHHETRIQAQMEALLETKSDFCLIKDLLLKIRERDPVAITYHGVGGLPKGLPGTILFKRCGVRYRLGTDGEDQLFVADLLKSGMTCALVENRPHLYTYYYHGDNISSYNHFIVIKKWSNATVGFGMRSV